jgi:hypothetical protein
MQQQLRRGLALAAGAVVWLAAGAAQAVDPVRVSGLARGDLLPTDALDIDQWSRALVDGWMLLAPHPHGGGINYLCGVLSWACFHELDHPTKLGGSGRSVGYVNEFAPGISVDYAAAWSLNGQTRWFLKGFTVGQPNFFSRAVDENPDGVIVGSGPNAYPPSYGVPMYWTSPTAAPQLMANLASFAGPFPSAINAAGNVVGSTNTTPIRAVIWTAPNAATFGYLGELPSGNTSHALDIDSSGIVVGSSNSAAGGAEIAVVWEPDGGGGYTVSALPNVYPGGSCKEARVANDVDEIAGNCTNAAGRSRGVVWRRIAGVWTPAHELGPFPLHTDSAVKGLNDYGEAVGRSYQGTASAAVLWELDLPPDPPPDPPPYTPPPVPVLGPAGLGLLAGALALSAALSRRVARAPRGRLRRRSAPPPEA